MNIAPSSFYPPSPSPSPSPTFFPDPALHSSSNPNLKISYSSDDSPYLSSRFNGPYMGVVLVVLLVTFFLMAAFSVYVRRYTFSLAEQAEAGRDLRSGRCRGLDRAAIDGLPIVVYHCAKEGDAAVAAVQAHEWIRRPDCVVCLTDFQEAEKLRQLPRCEHCFHPDCIDMWLFSHSTCPLCRRSLLPPPLPPSNDVCISVQAAVAPSEDNSSEPR